MIHHLLQSLDEHVPDLFVICFVLLSWIVVQESMAALLDSFFLEESEAAIEYLLNEHKYNRADFAFLLFLLAKQIFLIDLFLLNVLLVHTVHIVVLILHVSTTATLLKW